MGCGGSQDKELIGRLDAVAKSVRGKTSGERDEGLDDLESAASEIKGIFWQLCNEGAKDKDSMRQCEVLSDDILKNMLSRITDTELGKPESEYKPWYDKCVKIGQDLDSVRAAKASTAFTEEFQRKKENLKAKVEGKAAPYLAKMNENVEKMKKDPKTCVQGTKIILDLADKAQTAVPDSQKVTEDVLNTIANVSTWLLEQEKVWAVDFASCSAVADVAKSIDEAASKYVASVGGIWDPPVLPQVEAVQQKVAEAMCTKKVNAATSDLKKDQAMDAFAEVSHLLEWWPLLKDDDARKLEIVGIFSKIQRSASDAYSKATSAGDTDTVAAIKDFAQKIDDLRAKFDGLPPPAASDGGGGLGEVLSAADIKAAAIKALATMDAEVAKTKKSLAATIQALDSLSANWSKLPTEGPASADDALKGNVEKSCNGLEEWVEKQASSQSDPKVIEGLVKFAGEYDSRRSTIDPPAPKNGALQPRIASCALRAYLKAVENGLAKPEQLDVKATESLLGSLKKAAELIPNDGDDSEDHRNKFVTSEDRNRFVKTLQAADDCFLTVFTTALGSAATNDRHEARYMKCAEMLDEIRDSKADMTELLMSDSGQSLVKRLKEKRDNAMSQLIDKIEAHLAGTNFEKLLETFIALENMIGKTPLDDGGQARVKTVVMSMKGPLKQSCSDSASGEDMKGVDDLLIHARGLDSTIKGFGFEDQGFEASIVDDVTLAHVGQAEKVLSKTPLDCDALIQELVTFERLCCQDACTSGTREKVETVIQSLDGRLVEKMLQGGDAATVKSVVDVAKAADTARAAVRRTEASGDVSAKVASAKAVAEKLGQARKELDKESGSNPNTVVSVLKELHSLWAPVKDVEACRSLLLEVLTSLHGKVEGACQKAQATSDKEKRLQALKVIADEADKAQDALASLSVGLQTEKFVWAITSSSGDDYLKSIEQELGKETGMNPAELLKLTKALGQIWPELGGPGLDGMKSRWQAAHSKIKTRMHESMDDALKASNDKKKQGLLKFAADFDNACGEFSDGTLADELKAKMES